MDRYNFKTTEAKWQKFWEKNKTFKEPNIPNNEIGIMHLAAGIWKNGVDMRVDKNIKVNIKSLEGKILEKSLRNLIK